MLHPRGQDPAGLRPLVLGRMWVNLASWPLAGKSMPSFEARTSCSWAVFLTLLVGVIVAVPVLCALSHPCTGTRAWPRGGARE